MARISNIAFLACAFFLSASAETIKLDSMDQGAEFTKCIKITDFTTKRAADDVEVVAKDATSGCCPEGYMPGMKHYTSYWGTMISCGFKDDGTIAMTTSTSNGVKSCTDNKCYVVKAGHKCADDKLMKINGCCSEDNQKKNYVADCMSYHYGNVKASNSAKNPAKVPYCTSYHKKYKMEGTAVATDDQADGKLHLDKLYIYTPCSGNGASSGGGSGSGSGGSGDTASGSVQAALGCGSVAVLAVFATFF